MTRVGLYGKYQVSRWDGRDRPGHDKDNAEYFVLDLANDPYARTAMAVYAEECRYDEPELSRDLYEWLERLDG